MHTVIKKETWSSLSRAYALSIADLMKANPGITDLKTGQVICIPDKIRNEDKKELNHSLAYYTVRTGETLFSISRSFNTTVEQLQKWNQIENTLVQEGQSIVVGFNKEITIPIPGAAENKKLPVYNEVNENNTGTTDDASENSPALNNPKKIITSGNSSERKIAMQINESGICSWLTDGGINQNKYYALHRTAPAGTIIKVTNKMNSRYVFVKIVGVLPDTGDNEKTIIKISQAGAKKIGALDAHFQVELTYGILQ